MTAAGGSPLVRQPLLCGLGLYGIEDSIPSCIRVPVRQPLCGLGLFGIEDSIPSCLREVQVLEDLDHTV